MYICEQIFTYYKGQELETLVLYGAGDEARTRDILLGKEAFYH